MPEQHGGIHPALVGGDHLHRARHDGSDVALQPLVGLGVDQIGLVQHDQVGGHELVLVDLGQRVVVIDRRIELALAGDGLRVVGEAAGGHGRRIDHGDHAVHRQPRADGRPVEGLHQRLRQREPGGLDEDVLGRDGAVDQRLHGRDEILGHGAAQAAIGELDDILLRAALDAAAAQRLAVDADAAELIDDDGEPQPVGVLQQMADQRRFPGAEEAGDDGGGDAGERRSFGGILGLLEISGKAGDHARLHGGRAP